MFDAQATGVARLVRELAGIPASGEGWLDRLLERLGRLHLPVEGDRRLETLSTEAQADIRAAIGWTVPQEDVLAGAGVRDRWIVLGQNAFPSGFGASCRSGVASPGSSATRAETSSS